MTQRELRLLFLVAGAIVFVDTMFYAAVAPLLPALTHQLHLSKASAGLLTAGYPIGTLVGSIPGGLAAERVGPTKTLYTGLALLGGSSLAFGLLNNVVLLDVARVVQGIGGAFTWSGSMTWLIAEVPVERRGRTIGAALATAIGGALFGPLVGTLAHALGRPTVFSAVVVVAIGLAAAVRLLPAPAPSPERSRTRLLDQIVKPAIALGMWLTALPAVASGAINVLGPLRLGRLGAGAGAIGATFLVAAAAEAVVSPAVGHVSDRRGRMFPLRIGLAAATVALLCFTLPSDALVLAVVIVLITISLGTFWAPAMAMLSDAADAHGLSQGYALALINMAWAGGQVLGAGAGGSVAKATTDAVPFSACAALCAATLALVLTRPLRLPTRPAARRVP